MYTLKRRNILYMFGQKIMLALAYLEYGNGLEKITGTLLLTVVASPLAAFYAYMHNNIFTDSDFLNVIVICLLADMIGGMWKHYRLHTFSWKRLYLGLLEKIGVSFLGMILFNSIFSIHQWQGIDSAKNYLILIGKLANLLYICGSCFNNLYVITGGKFPPVGFMKRMANFNETLDTNKLTDKDVK